MSPDLVPALAAHVATTAHVVGARAAGAVGRWATLPAALDPDPDEARRWVQDELGKDAYQDRRSLLQQFLDWVRERLADLQNQQGGGSISFPPFVIAGLAVVLVVVVAVLASRVRRERRTVSSSVTVLGDSHLTAAQLRERAAAALAAGRFDDAVLDFTRAMARDADNRTLLTDAPSLTAHEIGRQLSQVFPEHAAAVTRATDRFDAVAYGHLAAGRAEAEDVRATDELLRRARPTLPERPRATRPGSGTGGGSGAGQGAPLDPGAGGPPSGADDVWRVGVGS